MNLKNQLESLLFMSARPMTARQLSQLTEQTTAQVKTALDELFSDYQARKSGIILAKQGEHYQMMTAGESAALVQKFVKSEMTGELSKPSLETLTIIAYRGPISKFLLEQIRGVNCGLILRNLMIRGLVETTIQSETKETRYRVTLDFLKYLGLSDVKELPEFDRLNSDENLQKVLDGTSSAV